MFGVTWLKLGELDISSNSFCRLYYDIAKHNIFYETCNGIRHCLNCDFSDIFDEIHSIVESDDFESEEPHKDGCDGEWYKIEYTINDDTVIQEGYIYGLEKHEKLVSLIETCAKGTLNDEQRLLNSRGFNNGKFEQWALDIMKSRQEFESIFPDFWEDIRR